MVINEMQYDFLERPISRVGMLLFEALMPLGLSLDVVQHWIEFTLSDLGMGYRESPLSWTRAGTGHLHAGDHVPNVPVVSDDGQWANLHRLLSLRHWTLLLRTADAGEEAVQEAHEVVAKFRTQIHVAVIKPTDTATDRELGRDRLMMLVRPDGHIGLMAHLDDTNALNEYLDTYLVQA